MKSKIFYPMIASLLLASSLYADPKVAVEFVDRCSSKVTAANTTTGSYLRLTFSGLEANTLTSVGIEITPARDAMGSHVIRFRTSKRTNKDGEMTIATGISFPGDATISALDLARVWTAEVRWKQENPELTGVARNSIYLVRADQDVFFRIEKTKPEARVCRWESAARLISNYEFNQFASKKTVELRLPFAAANADSGVDFGMTPPGDLSSASGPLFSGTDETYSGWIFPNWTNAYGKNSPFSMSVSQELDQGMGGVFVERSLGTRFLAQQYRQRWVTIRGHGYSCKMWEKGPVGFLDAVVPKQDFVIVPKEESDSQSKILDYVATVTPPVDSCANDFTAPLIKEDLQHLVHSSDIAHPLYFYPLIPTNGRDE